MDTLEQRIETMVQNFALELAREVRAGFAAQVTSLVAGSASTPSAPVRRGPGRPPKALTAAKSPVPSKSHAPTAKRHYPAHCIATDCRKAHVGGPRGGWFCEEHQSLSKSEKNKAKEIYKLERAAAT
jgi:hypothetical protein